MKPNNKELNIDLTLSLKKIPNKKILLSYLPVSQDQWREIIGYKHSSYKEEDERWNLSIQNSEFVNSITFNDIHFFISRINTISGKQYRLPTLEEMEEICKMSIENPEVNIAGLHDSYYLVTSTKDQNDLPVLTILKDNIMLPRYISRIEEVNGPDIVFRICRKAD